MIECPFVAIGFGVVRELSSQGRVFFVLVAGQLNSSP